MNVQKTQVNPNRLKLIIAADQELLDTVRNQVLRKLKQDMKVPGFRQGKVPLEIVEKTADQQVLQSEFLDTALNRLYAQVIMEQNIRPVASPQVNITKF